MFRRAGPHQLRGRALHRASRRVGDDGSRAGAVRALSLPAFPERQSALAARIPALCAATGERYGSRRLDQAVLRSGSPRSMAEAGLIQRHMGTVETARTEVKLVIAPGVTLWRERFDRAAAQGVAAY